MGALARGRRLAEWLALSLIALSLLALSLLALAGCGEPRTEIFVVVEGDLAIPADLDSVEVEIVAPDGAFQTATADLTAAALPRTLGVVWDGGRLDPFQITARGSRGARVVVAQSARVAFLHEDTVVLRLSLDNACLGVSCGADETCADSACRSVDVDADDLEPFMGAAAATTP